MSFFPTFSTFLEINIGSFHLSIQWYAVLILTGALICFAIFRNSAKKLGYDPKVLEDYFIYMMPLAIVGARLYYCIFEWSSYSSNPIRIFYLWEGGLAIHGGLIVGVIFSYFYFRSKGYNLLRVGDCVMPNILIAQAIGRIGNFMNHEAYGNVVSESFYDHFPTFIKENMYIDGFYRQPTFLFEAIGNLIGYVFIRFIFRKYMWKKRGDMIYAYVAWYGIVRFFVEGLRSDALMFMGLRIAQIVSIAFILIGVLGYIGVYDKVFKKFYPFKHEKPAILFDFDGTLVDTFPLIKESFKHTFKTHPITQEISDGDIQTFFGPPLKETFAKYYPIDMVEEVIATYREHNLKNHDAYVKAMPNAKELLDYLKAQEYEIAIVTSKLKDAAMLGLEVSGLKPYFDVVVTLDDVDAHKPNPEGLLKACALLNVAHDSMIYVGDTASDMKTAHNMGAYSIAYVSQNAFNEDALIACKPSAIIYDLIDIKTIIQEEREWSEFTI